MLHTALITIHAAAGASVAMGGNVLFKTRRLDDDFREARSNDIRRGGQGPAQLRWLIRPTAVDEIDPCLVAGPDYELVDVDVARPGRDKGDAVSDVLGAERD